MSKSADHPLITFLTEKMSMTDVYQPAIVKDLLEHEGVRSKSALAGTLTGFDAAVQEYYEKVVMRWPKITLTKHDVVTYERKTQEFRLVDFPEDDAMRQEAIEICDEKIENWLKGKEKRGKTDQPDASIRYIVLKEAHGKCELCGIPSSLRPIDIDHIIPRSKANRNGKVRMDGIWIDVNSRANLQALCMTCNRAKRAADQSDFRRNSKLVRDRIPEIIREDGRDPDIRVLSGRALSNALFEKLVEEHTELIAAKGDPASRLEELVDVAEVVLALAALDDVSEDEFLEALRNKRKEKGAFKEGFVLLESLGRR